MEWSIVLFFFVLLLPGFWLILGIRRELKQREWLDEKRRMNQERISTMSARRRTPRRYAPIHARSPVEVVARAIEITETALVDQAASNDWGSTQIDSWQELTASDIGTAFEKFLHASMRPSDDIKVSQIEEAFEKFLVDLSVVSGQ